jgi:hypothetical protein
MCCSLLIPDSSYELLEMFFSFLFIIHILFLKMRTTVFPKIVFNSDLFLFLSHHHRLVYSKVYFPSDILLSFQ